MKFFESGRKEDDQEADEKEADGVAGTTDC
jgi:hypothetical protein